MRERRAGHEHDSRPLDDVVHGAPHVVAVAVPVEIDTPEREPSDRDAEDGACTTIFFPPSASGFAFREEARATIPPLRRDLRLGIESEHGEELHPPAQAHPVRHRGAERQHTIVRMRRENDDRAHSTIIAALAAGAHDVSPSGWRRFVPASLRRRLRPVRAAVVDRRRRRPPRLGDLRRLTPIDPNWGFERGTPIDRVYVERFVGGHAGDIRGRVLEIAAPDYTSRFGVGVERVDILMAMEGNPEATIVGDLADAPHIPSDEFDCAIVTQTLQFVYDVRAALTTLERILAPGGVLLATIPGLTKISRIEDELFGEWWHYTGRSVRRLAEETFPGGTFDVQTYGNVLAASGFLYGLAASDLEPAELNAHDPLYEVVIGLRAVKRL